MSPSPPSIPPKIPILLVDDHEVVRYGISQLINKQPDMAVSAEASSVRAALEAVQRSRPGLVIIDISLKDSDGLELVKTLKAQDPSLPVLVLSMHDENVWAELALRAGARGYLMKESAIQQLLGAIRQILGGRIYVSEQVSARLLQQRFAVPSAPSATPPIERLTDRELQVLQHLGEWKSTRQIAAALNLSVKTIEYYRERLKEKLNLSSAAELVQYAVEYTKRPS